MKAYWPLGQSVGAISAMRSSISALVAVFALLFLAVASGSDRANAITFSPPNGSVVDFGNVAVGDSLTVPFDFSWSHSGGDDYALSSLTGTLQTAMFDILLTTQPTNCSPIQALVHIHSPFIRPRLDLRHNRWILPTSPQKADCPTLVTTLPSKVVFPSLVP